MLTSLKYKNYFIFILFEGFFMIFLRNCIFVLICSLILPLPFTKADIVNKNQSHQENIEKLLTDGRVLIKALKSKYSNSSLTSKSIGFVDNLVQQTVMISTALTIGTGVGFLASVNLAEPLLNQAYLLTEHSRTGHGNDLRADEDNRTGIALFVFLPTAVATSGLVYLIMRKVLKESQISAQELQAVISELQELEAIIAQVGKSK